MTDRHRPHLLRSRWLLFALLPRPARRPLSRALDAVDLMTGHPRRVARRVALRAVRRATRNTNTGG
jgi:hypothetical protein